MIRDVLIRIGNQSVPLFGINSHACRRVVIQYASPPAPLFSGGHFGARIFLTDNPEQVVPPISVEVVPVIPV